MCAKQRGKDWEKAVSELKEALEKLSSNEKLSLRERALVYQAIDDVQTESEKI